MTTDRPDATRRLASFATRTTLECIPATAIERAKLAMLDTIGVSLAALDFPIGRIVAEYVDAIGGAPVASVIGTGVRTSAPLAAQANGTLAHALDYDDHGHLSTHVIPASFAVAEMVGASGAQVLEAYLIGREVGAKLSAILEAKRKQGKGPTYRGWYRVGVVGPVAAAVAASKVLGSGEQEMTHAIAIACSSSAGLRRNLGTMTKALHAGNAATAGVTAALLAARGFTADVEVIEAPLGLVNAICQPGEADWGPLDQLGAPFELAKHLAVKRYPACSPSHMPVTAALQIRARHEFVASDIASVEAHLHEFSLLRTDPREAIASGYSLPFLLSVALIDGAVGLDQVGEARLFDPDVRALMAKVVHDPQASPSAKSDRVTVRLADGTVLTEQVNGKPDLTDDAGVIAKFVDCARRRVPPEQVSALIDAIAQLESLPAIGDLLALTRAATPTTVGSTS